MLWNCSREPWQTSCGVVGKSPENFHPAYLRIFPFDIELYSVFPSHLILHPPSRTPCVCCQWRDSTDMCKQHRKVGICSLIVPQKCWIFHLLPSRVGGNKRSIHAAINSQKDRKGAETTAECAAAHPEEYWK